MGRAKDIIVKVIPAKIANEFVKKQHYSGKIVNNSNLHFGCFLDGNLHGVMSFGSPMSKIRVLWIVKNSQWNEMLELNRMAFDDMLPKNSESRCIAIAIKMLKKQAPQIKWVLSFADATQCGDGAIYRASGFVLTNIKQNSGTYTLPNGKSVCKITYDKAQWATQNSGRGSGLNIIKEMGGVKADGFQLRYIYLIDKSCQLTCPVIPFSKIDELGAGMYKGKRITLAERKAVADGSGSGDQSENGGLIPTPPLQFENASNG